MPTLGAHWRLIAKTFEQAGFDSPSLDARLLTGLALGLSDVELIGRERGEISTAEISQIEILVQRRLTHEPVARIIGSKEFYGLAFGLNADTLVPRPETEQLVDLGLAFLGELSAPTCLDLGTGTGCLPISLLVNLPTLQATATDLSQSALDQAKANAALHQVSGRLRLFCGSWFSPLETGKKFDLILSNPPYIAAEICDDLQDEVRLFDPRLALDGGQSGLRAYEDILDQADAFLAVDGKLMFEIGFDQSDSVAALCRLAGFKNIELHKDLAGLPRIIVATR